jgi:beta-glucuronidase
MNRLINTVKVFILLAINAITATAQTPLLTNIHSRDGLSLNGEWQYIADPYETGFYNYRFVEREQNDPEAFWNSAIQKNRTERKEHGYNDKYVLNVPGDWNHQKPEFLFYEGTLWYKKSFDYNIKSNKKYFIYFGAVNYKADVYLNGKKLGSHLGGFTPFNFEIPLAYLKDKDNFLVVKVDNKRGANEVPTLNTDWWNYGGITREVRLVELPETFIRDFSLQLQKPKVYSKSQKKYTINGWIRTNGTTASKLVNLEIPELKVNIPIKLTDDSTFFTLTIPKLNLWSPENPKLYKVKLNLEGTVIEEQLGFRTIEASGKEVLLNGKSIFMRGICLHGEIPNEIRRAYSSEDAKQLLGQAKELGCNMVRLAHYPHDETITRLADSLGLMVWSEIPVYWTINFGNKEVLQKAKQQLHEMIDRDRNRASIIIWSVGNETPISPIRTEFMRSLISEARALDQSRMISAALEVNYSALNDTNVVDDPLGEYVDLVAFNEYLGWYGGLPDQCKKTSWKTIYNKPLFISETGAGAKGGFNADMLTRFSEEYQEWFYKEQIEMLKRMPDNFVGISPWVLNDFRSPKRNNPYYQEGWNRKGLYDNLGNKKKAFYILQNYYKEIKASEKLK